MTFLFQNLTISVVWILVVVSCMAFSFIAWNEGKRDGFDEEKMFDLVIISFASSALTYFIFDRLKISPNYLFLIIWVFPVYFFARSWRWSLYRVLDIFSMAGFFVLALNFAGAFFFNANNVFYVFLSLLNLILFVLAAQRRKLAYFAFSRNTKATDSDLPFVYKSKSGYIFSIFLIVNAIIFYSIKKYLPFSLLLITLSLVNLYLKLAMKNNFIPLNIMRALKERLVSKRFRLRSEAKLLDEEDPTRDTSRTYDNADEMDEAILEDARKIDTDIKKNLVTTMQIQVRKALASLKIGRYGKCEVCKKPIDLARLQAYPEATTCIEHSDK